MSKKAKSKLRAFFYGFGSVLDMWGTRSRPIKDVWPIREPLTTVEDAWKSVGDRLRDVMGLER